MINISFTVYKNGYRSSDPVDTIESIEIERLANVRWSSLCEEGARQHIRKEGTIYKEYDAYYFQVEDMSQAYETGMRHYRDNDLGEVDGEYSMFLYRKGCITLKELFSISDDAAYKKWKEFLNTL